jgi:hypothetical protein
MTMMRTRSLTRRYAVLISAPVTVICVAAAVLAPPAVADAADALRQAVEAARGGTSCQPLQPDPLAQQASAFVLQSTDAYLNHTARAVPIEDGLPVLKDLGSSATKVKVLQGAGQTEFDAIKFIFISGYNVIPDCGYTGYGASFAQNESDDYYLTAVVLIGA